MREIRHENLVPFLGACVDTGNVFILTPYCSRGNLHDVLGNEDYRIDNMFTASLVADLIKVSLPRRFWISPSIRGRTRFGRKHVTWNFHEYNAFSSTISCSTGFFELFLKTGLSQLRLRVRAFVDCSCNSHSEEMYMPHIKSSTNLLDNSTIGNCGCTSFKEPLLYFESPYYNLMRSDLSLHHLLQK